MLPERLPQRMRGHAHRLRRVAENLPGLATLSMVPFVVILGAGDDLDGLAVGGVHRFIHPGEGGRSRHIAGVLRTDGGDWCGHPQGGRLYVCRLGGCAARCADAYGVGARTPLGNSQRPLTRLLWGPRHSPPESIAGGPAVH